MIGKFQLYLDRSKEFRFRLIASNGRIILASEGYRSKQGAQNGIQSVRNNAPKETRYERKKSKNGQHMFNLVALNGRVIGSSEQYKTELSREKGIAAVKKNAPKAKIEDQTILARSLESRG